MGIETILQGALDRVKDALFPPLCVNCNKDGAFVCKDCMKEILWIDPYHACRMCGAPFGRLTCTCCKHEGDFHGCICAAGSGEIALKIVKTYKNAPEINLAPFIATSIVVALEMAEIAGVLDFSLSNIDGICHIPARFDSMIKRGFDHMDIVSNICAKLLNVSPIKCLKVDEVEDQRSLGREDRLENMKESIHVIQNVNGLNLLLIDDVITTGATILTAQRVLEEAGANVVFPAAFCRVW